MPRLIKKDHGNYTNISNVLVRDSRLTWKARGIFLYLWSQADNWQFYVKELLTHAPEGKESLQNGLKELEEYGYLQRINRHSDKSGKFGGLEWILDDNPVDGQNSQNSEKKSGLPSDGKTVQRKNRPPENSSLRNNNNKNYQYKEISNKRNLFSDDPFSKDKSRSKEEKEKIVDDLIGKFTSATGTPISHVQYNRIHELMMKLDTDDAADVVTDTTKVVMQSPNVISPVAYLIKILMNARDDSNG